LQKLNAQPLQQRVLMGGYSRVKGCDLGFNLVGIYVGEVAAAGSATQQQLVVPAGGHN
jgi:hypothetical protein